jgi:hypothetical protein
MAVLTYGKLFFFVFLLTLNFCKSSSFYTEETPLKLFSVHWGASRFNLSESEFRISLENGAVSSILIKNQCSCTDTGVMIICSKFVCLKNLLDIIFHLLDTIRAVDLLPKVSSK